MQKLILASASPRRTAMLREMDIDFKAVPSLFEEPSHAHGQDPQNYATSNAAGKARQVAANLDVPIVLGVDTIVVYQDSVLGKPSSMDEARHFLHMLNGKTHEVISGICLKDARANRELTGAEKTLVTFRKLTTEEIDHYLKRIHPLDKAGGYAIQAHGSIVVERIQGCYYNVVGMPLARIEDMLLQWHYSLFDYMSPLSK
jgi:septum formation protein